jgi:Family of unknown function (DUF5706)
MAKGSRKGRQTASRGSSAQLQRGGSAPSFSIPSPSERTHSTPPSPESRDAVHQTELRAFCDFHEGYVSRYIQLADAKAGVTLVLLSGVLGFLVNDEGFRKALRHGPNPSSGNIDTTLWGAAVALSAILFCGLGTVLSFWVLRPRFKPTANSNNAKGVTFWGDVARYPSLGQHGSYPEAVIRSTPGDILNDRLEHSYLLSCICYAKMRLLEQSMVLGAVGAVLTLVWFIWFAPAFHM